MIEYTKDNPLRVFEAFAGYSSQSLALKRLKRDYPDFDFVRTGWAEFDPESKQPIDRQPAAIANRALFPDGSKNYGDICKINWQEVPDFDLFTMSSPCQDFSVAGLGRGGAEGSGTRSSLLWECTKAITIKRPRYILMENVAALVSQKFIKYFHLWQERLEGLGYANFAQLLNSKDYGAPQNRLRIFMVSILRTEDEPDPKYYFPEPFPLEKRLKDVLEDKVDEKYYINDKLLEKIMSENAEKCDDDDEQDEDGLSDFGSLFEEDDFE